MPITRWYVEQPDKRIELEVNYVSDLGFVVEGFIHIYHTHEDGTRGPLRARIAFDGCSPGTPRSGTDGSGQGTEGRPSGGSSGGSGGSDTDAANSEVARATGSGPRVRRTTRMVVRAPAQE